MTENNLPRSEMTLDEAIKHAEEKSGCNNDCAMEHRQLAEWLKKLKNFQNILPRPVIRDGNGKLIKDYTPRDFFLKLQEEIFEHYIRDWRGSTNIGIAKEIADVITVCISYLNAIGYDEKERSEIFAKVNEKNEKRGYFRNA